MSMGKRIFRERPSGSLLFRILIWVLEVLLVVLLAYGVSHLFFRTVAIQENSMEPTISSGDTMFLDRLAFRFGSPGRGDVIAFRNTDEESESLHIKRVIGLPGETVEIRGGQIRVNGNLYNEVRELPSMVSGGVAEEGVVLGRDEYFVLGDNRNNSEDSRHSEIGNISKDHILGKAWLVISPFSKIRFL